MKTKIFLLLFVLICFLHKSNAQNWSYIGDSGLPNWLGTNDFTPLDIRTNSLTRMYITHGGQIGVNTTLPSANLDIYGGDFTRTLRVRSKPNSGNGLDNTEISAVSFIGSNIIGGNGFTAFYANKGGNVNTAAGYFDGKVIVNNGFLGVNDNPILLHFINDNNHGLRYAGIGHPFANSIKIDGPALYGYGGGVLGTKDYGSNTERVALFWDNNGNVGIGTMLANNPFPYKLAVNGTIGAKAVKVEVTSTTWPDFVFDNNYHLMPLKNVEEFINNNNHLPDIPSGDEIEINGLDVGIMLKLQMQKIEELTLYMIDLKKENEMQQIIIEDMKIKIKQISKQPYYQN